MSEHHRKPPRLQLNSRSRFSYGLAQVWGMDQGGETGTTAFKDRTYAEADTVSWGFGPYGRHMTLGGAGCLHCPATSYGIGTDQGYSLFAIFRTSSAALQQIICADRNGGGDPRVYQFRMQAGVLEFLRFDSVSSFVSTTQSGGGYDDGNWHTAVATYGRQDGGSYIFVDGRQEGSDPATVLNNDASRIHMIGARGTSAAYTDVFSGDIAVAYLYNRYLTPQEAVSLSIAPYQAFRPPASFGPLFSAAASATGAPYTVHLGGRGIRVS